MQNMSKGKKFIIIIIILFFSGLIYFISNAIYLRFKYDLGAKNFLVEDKKVECYGEWKMECFIVNGELFYDYIKGFDYEEGYQYTISVEVKLSPEYKDIISGRLADVSIYTYELIKIISKTKTNTENINDIKKPAISSYIGLIYPPDPEGVISDINKDSNLGGSVIMNNDYSGSTPYGLQMAKTPNGYELWLDKLIDIDSSGKVRNIIIDSLLISKEEIGSYMFGGLCGKENSLSPNAGLAIDWTIVVRVDLTEYYSKGRAPALFAWKTNLKTEKYELYPTDGIFCIDPSAGIDTD